MHMVYCAATTAKTRTPGEAASAKDYSRDMGVIASLTFCTL